MRILGIDPGIGRIGYAIVDIDGHKMTAKEYGCITTASSESNSKRLLELKNDLVQIIKKNKPEAANVEKLVFVHNATSAVAVSQARGVILMVLEELKVPISEYAPTEIKKAISGSGAADKQEVGLAVKLIFNLDAVPKPDDAADALALTVCHAGQIK